MEVKKLVGWNVRRTRVAKGWSMLTLGTEAGIDPSFVARIERGVANPSISIVDKIAEALAVPVRNLFDVPQPDATAPAPLRSGRKKS